MPVVRTLSGGTEGVVTGSFIIDSHDIGEAEALLSANYTRLRLSEQSCGAPTRTRVWRTKIGSLDVDDFEYSYDLRYEAEPPEMIMLCRILKGAIEDHQRGRRPEMFTAGESAAIGAIDAPYTGFVHRATFTLISIDRHTLSEVASSACGDGPVRLTSSAPISADASQHMVDVIDHVRHTVANSPFTQQPFLAGSLARYLAATIAAAVNVTPLALQSMFRGHRNCTPMDYVRRVRLHYAHLEIVDSDPETTSVTGIAGGGDSTTSAFSCGATCRRTAGEADASREQLS